VPGLLSLGLLRKAHATGLDTVQGPGSLELSALARASAVLCLCIHLRMYWVMQCAASIVLDSACLDMDHLKLLWSDHGSRTQVGGRVPGPLVCRCADVS
jgi:hypothetical protein